MSRLAHSNIFLDPTGSTVVYTDQGASFDSDVPMANMSKMQIPLFSQFTGATAEVDADAGASYTVDTLALIGHTLTDGMEVEFLDGATSLGTVIVANYRGLAQNVILLLDTPVSLQTLTVSITGGAGGVSYRIGALWASSSFEAYFESKDFSYDVTSLSKASYASATGYTAARDSYDMTTITFPYLTNAQAIGPAYPNIRAIFRETGAHNPVIVIPIESELTSCVYALLDSMGGPSVRSGPIWTASCVAREQR